MSEFVTVKCGVNDAPLVINLDHVTKVDGNYVTILGQDEALYLADLPRQLMADPPGTLSLDVRAPLEQALGYLDDELSWMASTRATRNVIRRCVLAALGREFSTSDSLS